MIDYSNWILAAAAVIGSPLGAFLGVKVAVARLQERVKSNETLIKLNSDDISLLRDRSHVYGNALQGHEVRLDGLDKRVDGLEGRIDKVVA